MNGFSNMDDFWAWYDSQPTEWLNNWNSGNSTTTASTTSPAKGVNWDKVISGIITGGVTVLTAVTAFVQAKKGTNATVKNMDEATAARLLQLTGGNLSAGSINSATDIEARNAGILGIPLSTWIIIIGGVIAYMLFKNSNSTKSNKK